MRKKSTKFLSGASLVLASAFVCTTGAANAQTSPVVVTTLPNPNDPNVQLANSLKILAQNPYNVDALLSAGKGALAAGDPNAALGFLARAEELSPRNPYVKTALGSALVQLERPTEALRIFAEAYGLGVPDYEYASDRGLANDLQGDTKAAQRDYALAFRGSRNDELIRRFALSLGVSGEKAKALDLLEPLTRRGDQAAWRAKAFVLAMNGDIAGADRIVSAVMPPNVVGIMTPFMRRLPTLTNAQRARAVHFGSMPQTQAVGLAVVDPGDSFKSISGQASPALASPPVVAAAPRVDVTRPRESAGDRRRREKQERELAKLAERGRRASNLPAPVVAAPIPVPRPVAPPMTQPVRVAVNTPTVQAPRQVLPPQPVRTTLPAPSPIPAPVRPVVQAPVSTPPAVKTATVTAPTPTPTPTSRVGGRIGDVDPKALEPYLGPPTPRDAGVTTPPRAVLAEGVRSLPTPASPVVTPPAPTINPPAPVTPLPKPVVSMPVSTPTQPAPVVNAPVVTAPNPTPAPAIVRVEPAVSAPAPSSLVITPPTVAPSVPAPQLPAPNILPPVIQPAPAVLSSPSSTPITPRVAGAAPVAQVPVVAAPSPVVEPRIVAPPVASAPLPSPAAAPIVSPPAPVVTAPTPTPPVSAPAPSINIPNPAPGFSLTPSAATSAPAAPAPTDTEAAPVTPPAQIIPPTTVPAPSATPPIATAEAPPAPAPAEEPKGLASILADLPVEEQSTAGPIPDEAEFRARQLAAKRKEDTARAAAEKEARLKAAAEAEEKIEAKAKADAKAKLEAEALKKKEEADAKAKAEAAKEKAAPARLWVQIATGANRGGLPITWRKLKTDAPKALEGQSAYTVPFRATNRLVIGPFKSGADARAKINQLSKEGVFASLYSSEAGQEVSRLGGK